MIHFYLSSDVKVWLLAVLLLISVRPVFSQKSQTEVYRELIKKAAARFPEGVSYVEGDTLSGIATGIKIRTNRPHLKLDFPDIEFEKIAPQSFRRSMVMSFSLIDTSKSQSGSVSYADTLSLAEVRRIRKEALPDLRGGAITALGKLVRPAALVAGSIGAVLLLFRLRTR